MNKNMLIVLAGGLTIAVLVAVLVQTLLGRSKPTAPVASATEVIVAAHSLSAGAALQESDLKWQSWPGNSVFPGLVIRKSGQKPLEAISGRLIRPVAEGEPVLESAVVKETSNAVADMLKDGMRAVAITVSAQTEAGGFVLPGDHVDIILTYRNAIHMDDQNDPRVKEMLALNLRNMASETILRNVRILAVDQSPDKPSAGGNKPQGRVSRTVTVEAGKRDSEILALAPSLGTISLALRKPGDTTPDEPEPNVVTDERITHVTEELYKQAHKISASNNVVRVYNGYEVQDQQTAHQ